MRIHSILFVVSAMALHAQQDPGRRVVPRPSNTTRRFALLIGNKDYSQQPLANPVNDATDLGAALTATGFTVTVKTNLRREAMDEALSNFAATLDSGDSALVYFSGHGLEVQGQNYLLPVDFTATAEYQVRNRALNANEVLDAMRSRGVAVSILILDACRTNPYRPWMRSPGGGGLAALQADGAYIAFAAAPGQIASDNPGGRNGPLTKHLKQVLDQPGLTIDDVFNEVRQRVYRESPAGQRPFSTTGLIGRFVFRDGAPIETASVHTRLNPKDGLTYVYVPPGKFTMGCSAGDNECYDDEKPPKQVTIAKGFYMSESEVTQGAYQRVTGKNPSTFKGADLPVDNVPWQDAAGYCQQVGGRLPTEAEWEYAARAGGQASRYGDVGSIAWYTANSGNTSHPVKKKLPNAFGLFDMLGNANEWTSERMHRGSSWHSGHERTVRVSFRLSSAAVDGTTGFRCAWE